MTEYLETEVLILGSGIAGATAALQLADQGLHVTMVTRASDPQESNTLYAQGGIIYRGVDDTPAALAEDITRAGGDHCNPIAVSILAREGPDCVDEILRKRAQVDFDRTESGELSLARADLVAAMDPALVEASEIAVDGASFHFIVHDLPPDHRRGEGCPREEPGT